MAADTREDTVPPATDDLTPVTRTLAPRRTPPEIDVPALSALLDEMAATGQTGMGFPEEYGGGGDIGASVAAFETLAFGDLSVLVKVGVQVGLFGGAILQPGQGVTFTGLDCFPDLRGAVAEMARCSGPTVSRTCASRQVAPSPTSEE
jgi:alkylation response protein AidB-like acyl-CoA dehydrogenase